MTYQGPRLDQERLEQLNECFERSRSGNVALCDVVGMAELMIGSMQHFFEGLDSSIYTELRDIAKYLASAKEDIRNLQAHDIKNNRIPEVGQELDAIVQSTESATNTIMEQAERIMCADTEDADAYQGEINDAVTQIFEACSFQDLTGQRIAKIVETINFIDTRIGRLTNILGQSEAVVKLTEEEAAREKRRKELLTNGPQLDGDAISQNDVDAVMQDGASDAKVEKDGEEDGPSQEDIDAMFA